MLFEFLQVYLDEIYYGIKESIDKDFYLEGDKMELQINL